MDRVDDVDEIQLVQPQPLLKLDSLCTSLSEIKPVQPRLLLELDSLFTFSTEI